MMGPRQVDQAALFYARRSPSAPAPAQGVPRSIKTSRSASRPPMNSTSGPRVTGRIRIPAPRRPRSVELRMLLEPAAVEKACGNVDGALLRRFNAKCTAGYVPGDIASEMRFMEANRSFHMEIARASGNSRLYTALSQIMDEMTRLLHLGFVLRERPAEMHQEHDSLIDALVNNDKKRARVMTETHIATVRKLVIEGLIDGTNLTSTNISGGRARPPR
jgi:hypothetical protein